MSSTKPKLIPQADIDLDSQDISSNDHTRRRKSVSSRRSSSPQRKVVAFETPNEHELPTNVETCKNQSESSSETKRYPSRSRSRSQSHSPVRKHTPTLPTLSKSILKPHSASQSPYAESLPSPGTQPTMESIFRQMTEPVFQQLSTSHRPSSQADDGDNTTSDSNENPNPNSIPLRRRTRWRSNSASDAVPSNIQDSPKHLTCKFSHTYLVHTVVRASLLSKESPEQEYRGFFNLALLLLGVSNVRLIIENFVKYGLLLNHKTSSLRQSDFFWVLVSWAFQAVPVYVSFWIETFGNRLLSSKRFKDIPLWPLHTMNIILLISVASFISWSLITHPVLSFAPLFTAAILSLKLVSYALVNNDLRQEAILNIHLMPIADKSSKEGRSLEDALEFDVNDVPYPSNLTFGNLIFFCLAPTLCYQTAFPRTKRIRRGFLFKRGLELAVAIAGAYFFTFQYAEPTLRNSLDAFEKMDMIRLVERVLKLSVISVTLWLLMFWSFFHCLLNIIAELLQFGDRRFYQHWWNAKDISDYWRLWNTPVYTWAKRHVYLPLILNYNVNPMLALLFVFFISAFLHELLIGVPTHTLNGVAFFGMLAQIPLIFVTKLLSTLRHQAWSVSTSGSRETPFDTIGNYLFWLTFTIIGQPTCILIYYAHWYAKHRGSS